MKDMDRELRERLPRESDELLFAGMALNDRVKDSIRKQAAADHNRRRFAIPRSWIGGMTAIAAAILLIVAIPVLQQASDQAPAENTADSLPPANGGSAAGSELSQLTTTPLGSADEAKAAFGQGLLVPNAGPEGYELADITAVGMEGEPARDVIFTYAAGEKTVTFTASRNPAAFPADLFSPVKVDGADGFVYEQPGLIELFWVRDGIQYAITGPLTGEEAMRLAESAA